MSLYFHVNAYVGVIFKRETFFTEELDKVYPCTDPEAVGQLYCPRCGRRVREYTAYTLRERFLPFLQGSSKDEVTKQGDIDGIKIDQLLFCVADVSTSEGSKTMDILGKKIWSWSKDMRSPPSSIPTKTIADEIETVVRSLRKMEILGEVGDLGVFVVPHVS